MLSFLWKDKEPEDDIVRPFSNFKLGRTRRNDMPVGRAGFEPKINVVGGSKASEQRHLYMRSDCVYSDMQRVYFISTHQPLS